MEYNEENMAGLLGNMATRQDAEEYAAYLEAHGWKLVLLDGQFVPFKNGYPMSGEEWQETGDDCFNKK